MMRRMVMAAVSLLFMAGITGITYAAVEPEVIQVQLAAPPDKVKQAVEEVLTNSGYTNIVWKNDSTLVTDYREEFESVWLGLYQCCWGVVKSRAEATVTQVNNQTTQLRLQVSSEGKRTLWESFAPVQSQTPESPQNQLRLIKNKLKIVSHPYTTQSFFNMQ